VVRLDETAAGASALVSAGSGAATRLYAMWSANGLGIWTVSAALPVGAAPLLSTGVTAAGAFVVSVRHRSAASSASVVGSLGSRWSSLPPLPSGATSVTAGPAGGYDALAPDQSTLSVFTVENHRWVKVQQLHVDVPYGSSD
jgi:hypothetical protein